MVFIIKCLQISNSQSNFVFYGGGRLSSADGRWIDVLQFGLMGMGVCTGVATFEDWQAHLLGGVPRMQTVGIPSCTVKTQPCMATGRRAPCLRAKHSWYENICCSRHLRPSSHVSACVPAHSCTAGSMCVCVRARAAHARTPS